MECKNFLPVKGEAQRLIILLTTSLTSSESKLLGQSVLFQRKSIGRQKSLAVIMLQNPSFCVRILHICNIKKVIFCAKIKFSLQALHIWLQLHYDANSTCNTKTYDATRKHYIYMTMSDKKQPYRCAASARLFSCQAAVGEQYQQPLYAGKWPPSKLSQALPTMFFNGLGSNP